MADTAATHVRNDSVVANVSRQHTGGDQKMSKVGERLFTTRLEDGKYEYRVTLSLGTGISRACRQAAKNKGKKSVRLDGGLLVEVIRAVEKDVPVQS
jgi:hypothetical protein